MPVTVLRSPLSFAYTFRHIRMRQMLLWSTLSLSQLWFCSMPNRWQMTGFLINAKKHFYQCHLGNHYLCREFIFFVSKMHIVQPYLKRAGKFKSLVKKTTLLSLPNGMKKFYHNMKKFSIICNRWNRFRRREGVDEERRWTQVVWFSWNPTGTGRAVSLFW